MTGVKPWDALLVADAIATSSADGDDGRRASALFAALARRYRYATTQQACAADVPDLPSPRRARPLPPVRCNHDLYVTAPKGSRPALDEIAKISSARR